jgi:hypothetical protein
MRRITCILGVLAVIKILVTPLPAQAQDTLVPFAPPAQYTSKPGKPFDSLLAADVKWLQSKVVDRKRKRRYQENSMRLPGADKGQIQPLIDQISAEIKDAEAQLLVLKAKQPDRAAQKELLKTQVKDWIKGLGERATNLRKDATDASERARTASKQFDIAKAQADADEDKKNADDADKEAQALADDLKAALQ